MKERYERLTLELIAFDEKDLIITSGDEIPMDDTPPSGGTP